MFYERELTLKIEDFNRRATELDFVTWIQLFIEDDSIK